MNSPDKIFKEYQYTPLGRKYIFTDDTEYYGVTSILDTTKDASKRRVLQEWRDRVGHTASKRITERATDTGTSLHYAMECYMLDTPYTPTPYIAFLMKQLTPYIDKFIDKVHYTEKILYSDKLGIAGTVDAIVDFVYTQAHIPTILDFKTAKRQGKLLWYMDYFLQLALYAMMYEEMSGNMITRGALLFAYKEYGRVNDHSTPANRRNREGKRPLNLITIDLTKYFNTALSRVEQFKEYELKFSANDIV